MSGSDDKDGSALEKARSQDAWNNYCAAFHELFGEDAKLELSPAALLEFTERLKAQILAVPSAEGAEDQGCACHGCAAVYRIDVLLPNDVWAKISPKPVEGFGGGGLLCPACIFQRLGQIYEVAAWQLVGADSSPERDSEAVVIQRCQETIAKLTDKDVSLWGWRRAAGNALEAMKLDAWEAQGAVVSATNALKELAQQYVGRADDCGRLARMVLAQHSGGAFVPGQRRVVCAAMLDHATGKITLLPRHLGAGEQGFVDQRGDFLTREEAWKVAEGAGQIIRRVGGDGDRLYSENLY